MAKFYATIESERSSKEREQTVEQDKRLYVVVIVIGVLAVLLSTCLGACAGGIVGYWAGRNASSGVAEGLLREFQEWKRQPIEPEIELPRFFEPERPRFVPERGGALVTKVVDGSPADKAGIRSGDLILAVDGVPIAEENTLQRIIREHRPGDRVQIALWSRGRERTVKVKLGAHPEEKDVTYLGVYYVLLTIMEHLQTR